VFNTKDILFHSRCGVGALFCSVL